MDGETNNEGADRKAAFRYRQDGWTPMWQVAFLRATACVRARCVRAGRAEFATSAYRVKRRLPEFGAPWDAVFACQLPALERAAYARVVEGWLEANVYKGEMVAHRRRNSDAMLRLLLQREDARPIPVGVKASGGRLVTSGQEAFGEL